MVDAILVLLVQPLVALGWGVARHPVARLGDHAMLGQPIEDRIPLLGLHLFPRAL